MAPYLRKGFSSIADLENINQSRRRLRLQAIHKKSDMEPYINQLIEDLEKVAQERLECPDYTLLNPVTTLPLP
ncbi:MAG: hypothetical protein OHK0053_13920 [Microscillaceae bacterium]